MSYKQIKQGKYNTMVHDPKYWDRAQWCICASGKKG